MGKGKDPADPEPDPDPYFLLIDHQNIRIRNPNTAWSRAFMFHIQVGEDHATCSEEDR